MSSVTSTSIPKSLIEVILNVGETAVPFSHERSSFVSKNILNVTETLSGVATTSTLLVSFSVVAEIGSTFMAELDAEIVYVPFVRYIKKFPASSISSLHSSPFSSVAIISAPLAPVIPSPQVIPDPLIGESLSHTVPCRVLESCRIRSLSTSWDASVTSIPAVKTLLVNPAKLCTLMWNSTPAGILMEYVPFCSSVVVSKMILPERASTFTLPAGSLISIGISEGVLY